MMKFLTDDDAKMFLIEIGKFNEAVNADKNYQPVEEEIKSLIKKRDGLMSHMKDHRKGQDTKAQWRKNRHKMMRGIKSYHRSTEGKRFHRNLGNFLATRLFRKDEGISGAALYEAAKAVTSARTHLYIELQYYHQLMEQYEVEALIERAIPILTAIESKIISGEKDLSEDEQLFLMDVIEEQALKRAFSEVAGKTEEEVEELKNSLSLT